MKRAALFLMLCMVVLVSCSKSDANCADKGAVTGTWKLVETLADPGDGSGKWQPASASLTLTFHPDGAIGGDAFPQARRYEVASNTNLRFTFADGTFINYNYALTETTLTLSGGGCIEACGAKFIKTSSSNH